MALNLGVVPDGVDLDSPIEMIHAHDGSPSPSPVPIGGGGGDPYIFRIDGSSYDFLVLQRQVVPT